MKADWLCEMVEWGESGHYAHPLTDQVAVGGESRAIVETGNAS